MSEAFAQHIAIGITHKGKVKFIGSILGLNDQCQMERDAVDSGKYKKVVRINDNGSVFELKRVETYSYEHE